MAPPPGQKPAGGNLVAVSLARHVVGQRRDAARMRRGTASRKARYRHVEAAPEKVDGTDLAQIAGTEALQHPVDLDERAKESRHGFRVVRPLQPISRERDWVGDLIRSTMQFRRAPKGANEDPGSARGNQPPTLGPSQTARPAHLSQCR